MPKFKKGQKVCCTEGLPWFSGKVIHVNTVVINGEAITVYLVEAITQDVYARLECELSAED